VRGCIPVMVNFKKGGGGQDSAREEEGINLED
jgi:hypothetical protein